MRILWIVMVVILLLPLGVNAQNEDEVDSLTLFWDQVAAQPDDFAVACLPLRNPSKTVYYNAGERFPLASVSKLLIFVAYAQRLDAGEIDLSEEVSVATLERYNLPRTDRGAHDRFIEQYPPGTASLYLWDVATQGMIQYSSNAASDFMLDRLGEVDWADLYNRLFVLDSSPPTSLTMIPLMMNNHETGRATAETVAELSTTYGEGLLDLYVTDALWRQAEIDYRGQPGRSRGMSLWPDWEVQAEILQDLTATGTAIDYLNVLDTIYGERTALSGNVKYMVRQAMRWRDNDFINNNYKEYGSKLGFYSGGVLTLVAYGELIGGTPVISATFFRNIPREMYFDMRDQDSIGDFAHWVNQNGCLGLDAMLDQYTS